MARISRRAAMLGVLGAGLAGCSTAKTPTAPPGAPASPTPTPSANATPSATPSVDSRPRWPLTGVLLKNPGDAHHAAVAVKVPDNREEHPQRGIDQADIVFVELEGYRDSHGYSSTRLVPVFHSQLPDRVEPVRSIRPVDIALLSPMDAIIGNTGGAAGVIAYVKDKRAHVEGMLSYANTRGTGSYGTDGSRVYSIGGQNYYDRATICHPKVLAQQIKRFRNGPPQQYFPWASTTAQVSTTRGKSGRSVSIPYKGDGYRMSYSYDTKTKTYLRSMPWGPHHAANGKRVAPDNVLVIKVHQHFGKVYGKGHKEPLEDTINTKGVFFYFNQGKYVTGTWGKGPVAEPFRFTLPDGSPFAMATGQTYVELPDTHAKVQIKA